MNDLETAFWMPVGSGFLCKKIADPACVSHVILIFTAEVKIKISKCAAVIGSFFWFSPSTIPKLLIAVKNSCVQRHDGNIGTLEPSAACCKYTMFLWN